MSSVIAIVGRPNVGKSALFNRIAGRRLAIVHDQPGVTRDRLTVEAEWEGRPYTLVDTGGIGLERGEKSNDKIARAALDQVKIAVDSASVIILVVNGQDGLTPLDQEVALRLRAAAKPVVVAVNKIDNVHESPRAADFARLGYEKIFPVSAIHGLGITDLMAGAFAGLSGEAEMAILAPEKEDGAVVEPPAAPLRLAVVGRPNVGKSSLINALTNSERVIVSPVPGTTRDAIDVPLVIESEGRREKYILIDTAGQRKSRRVDDAVEFFSVNRAEQSIARCDLALLVLDAEAGIMEQDKKIAGKIVEERKACILIINKWDVVRESVVTARKEEIAKREQKIHRNQQKTMTTLTEFASWVQNQLFFLDYAPVVFASAVTGFHLDRLLEVIRYVASQLQQKIPTALLNRTLNDAIERRQPVSRAGDRLKFFYATQVKQAPPTFLLFVNKQKLMTDRYAKYLMGELRGAFGFEGCPLILASRSRPKTIEPIRKKGRRL